MIFIVISVLLRSTIFKIKSKSALTFFKNKSLYSIKISPSPLKYVTADYILFSYSYTSFLSLFLSTVAYLITSLIDFTKWPSCCDFIIYFLASSSTAAPSSELHPKQIGISSLKQYKLKFIWCTSHSKVSIFVRSFVKLYSTH